MFLHIRENYLNKGVPLKTATSRAAATVNRRRASLGRAGRGPRLVRYGGSRRQWYPGKKVRREIFACLEHGRKFKSKAGLVNHYRSHHRRAARRRARR